MVEADGIDFEVDVSYLHSEEERAGLAGVEVVLELRKVTGKARYTTKEPELPLVD